MIGASTLRSGRLLHSEEQDVTENATEPNTNSGDQRAGTLDVSARPRETTRRTGYHLETEDLLSEAAGGDALTTSRNPFLDKDSRDCPERVMDSGLLGTRPLYQTPRPRLEMSHDDEDRREEDLLHKIAVMIREERNNPSTMEGLQDSGTPRQDRNVQLDGMRQRRAMNPILHRINHPYITEREYQDRWTRERGIPQAHDQQNNPRVPVNHAQMPRTNAPYYDGTSPWADYLVQFEIVAELNGWNDGLKAMYLATSLRGVAQSVLGDLDELGRRHYPTLVARMNQRFGSENQTEMFRAILRNRTRKPGETLPDLAHEIRRLVKLAYPTGQQGIIEDLAKNHFIDALPEGEYRWNIQQTRPRNLDEAVRVAVELEAFHIAEKHRNVKKNVRVINNQSRLGDKSEGDANKPTVEVTEEVTKTVQELVSNSIQALEKSLKEMILDSKTVKHTQDTKWRLDDKRMECYHCGELGHIRPRCEKYREFRRAQGNRRGGNQGN